MTKFKKLLKAEVKKGLVYCVEHEGNYYIGTRYYMIRINTLQDKFRQMLAEVGIFEANKAINTGKEVTPPTVHKLMPQDLANYKPVNMLPLHYRFSKDVECKLGVRDSAIIAANREFIEAMEELFQQSNWQQETDAGPLILGNSLALVLPIRTANASGEDKLKDALRTIVDTMTIKK